MTSRLEPSYVIWIHDMVVSRYGIPPGFQNKGTVESILAKIEFLDSDDVFWNGALILEGVARLHPFVDGNKRTALQSARQYLELNGHILHIPPDADAFICEISATKENRPEETERLVERIKEWLRRNSVQDQVPE